MGLLDNLERGLEKAMRSAFSAGGQRSVKPVEIANALRLTMDDEALVLAEGRTFVPNVFSVGFSPDDFVLARKWGSTLAEELCDEAIRHAREQGYTLQGPVRVTFLEDESLRPGSLEVESSTERGGQVSPRSQQSPGHHDDGRLAPSAAPAPARTPHPSPRPQPQPQPQPHYDDRPLQPVLEIEGRKYALNDPSIILGRSADADILVEDTGVSRRHLEIITRGRTVTAVDLGSTNGFSVNHRRVEGSTVLRDGDSITLGRVTMTFRMLPARNGSPGTDPDERGGRG